MTIDCFFTNTSTDLNFKSLVKIFVKLQIYHNQDCGETHWLILQVYSFIIACASWCTRSYTHAHTLNKIRRYKMLAVPDSFNCSSNLARLKSTVTLSQGTSTWWPLLSRSWNNCMSLNWRVEVAASTEDLFSSLMKDSQTPSPRASLNVCWASW